MAFMLSMEPDLTKILPVLFASAALLAPTVLNAESILQPQEGEIAVNETISTAIESIAEQGGGPLLQRLVGSAGDWEIPINSITLGNPPEVAPGKEIYRNFMLEGMRVETLTIEGQATGPLSVAIENAADMAGVNKVAALRLDFDPALVNEIRMLPPMRMLEDDNLQEICARLTSGITGSLWGLQSAPSAEDDSSLKIASLEFSGRATPAGDSCVGDLWGHMSGFDLQLAGDDETPVRVQLDSLDFKMKRLIDRALPEADLGTLLSDHHEIRGLRASFNGIGDALTLAKASITSSYHSDDLSALARAGANGLAAHIPLTSDADAPAALDMGQIWNVFRQASGKGALSINQLQVKAPALVGMPAAVLGMEGIESLDFTGDMTLDKKAENLTYGIFQTLDPLMSFGIEAKLHLDEAEEGLTQEPADFMPPASLRTAHVLLDDRGADALIRKLTGSGIVEMVASQVSWMPEAQQKTVADWVGSSIGTGQSAKLRIAPETPVALSDLAPMLMGDWSLLGATLNVSTMD
jgi:hypothetical protein